MITPHKSRHHFIKTLFIAAILLAGCAQSQPQADLMPTETSSPTETPLPAPTDTPQPTSTRTPTPTATLTPTPEPTYTPTPNLKATKAAQATQTMDAVLALIDTDLKTIDLSISQGWLGFYNPEKIMIDNSDYNMIIYQDIESENEFKNFVLHTDITWDSTSGLAGCGLILRAQDPDLEEKALLFGTWRLSGYPAWDLSYWNYGSFQSSISGGAVRNDNIIQDNNSTNEYLLVLQDTLLTSYVNGARIQSSTISAVPDAGGLGIFTRQESGETHCIFTNTWVWSFD